jgi:hypothetical protein
MFNILICSNYYFPQEISEFTAESGLLSVIEQAMLLIILEMTVR